MNKNLIPKDVNNRKTPSFRQNPKNHAGCKQNGQRPQRGFGNVVKGFVKILRH